MLAEHPVSESSHLPAFLDDWMNIGKESKAVAKTAVALREIIWANQLQYVEALSQPLSPTPTNGYSQYIQPKHQNQNTVESL